jgi:hypothetical protein
MPNYIGNEPLLGVNTRERLTGTGAATVFTLSRTPAQADGLLVMVSGVVQDSTMYSVVGKTLTFQEAPPAAVPGQPSQNIDVVYLSRQGAPYTANWRIPIADNGGTSDALTASFNPALTSLTDNLVVKVVLASGSANTTASPTFNPNGLGAANIVNEDGTQVSIGQLRGTIELRYEASTLNWRIVQRQVGINSGGITPFTASSAIPTTACGTTCIANSAAGISLSLPLASSVAPGATVELLNINSGTVNVQRSGTDIIQPNDTGINTISVASGENLVLRSDGLTKWYVVSGSAQLPYTSGFEKSLSVNGYQKLPSGLIMQWGSLNINGGSNATVTYPIAFSSTPKTICSMTTPSAGTNVAYVNSQTTTTFSANVSGTGASAFTWLAIGY